jgi:hypothetical protein
MYRQRLFSDEKGRRIPFDLVITDPARHTEAKEGYFCDIEAPGIFERPKRIYGIDREQALALSYRFVELLLQDKDIFDDHGNRVMGLLSVTQEQ